MTVSELIAFAAEQGYHVTSRQIDRWHKAGLLPRRQQCHVAGLRGSTGRYPPNAELQLLALCQLLRSRRQLDEARFWLWWDGYPVRGGGYQTLWRTFGLTPQPLPVTPLARDPFDAAEDWAFEQLAAKKPETVVRDVRRRLRNDQDVLSVLTNVFLASHGQQPAWTVYEPVEDEGETPLQELTFRGLGFPEDIVESWRRTAPGIRSGADVMPMLFSMISNLHFWDFSVASSILGSLPEADIERLRQLMHIVLASPLRAGADGADFFALRTHDSYRIHLLFIIVALMSIYVAAIICVYDQLPLRTIDSPVDIDKVTRRSRVVIRAVSMKLRKRDANELAASWK